MQTIFITGTDTGAGKTILAVLLIKFLRGQNFHAAALKPVCSGGRDDARKIFDAMNGELPLDEINPRHFRAPIAPALAARLENKEIKLAEIVAHIRNIQKRFDWVIIEGAGGILSPLGENFDSRILILKLNATPIVAAPNRLGIVNHIRLTLETLPEKIRRKTKIVLMSPQKPDAATATNVKLLAEFFPAENLFSLPWLGKKNSPETVLKNPRIRRTLRELAQ